MRGWLHAYAFGVAVVAGIVLCAMAASRPGPAAVISCVIYSVTVCALFGTSALYHRRVWSRRMYPIMRRLDHSMIFVFIAGTYTPFAVLLLSPATATTILAIVWGGALAGVVLKLVWIAAPKWLSAVLYVSLGWVALIMLPDLWGDLGWLAVAAFGLGGLLYTVGAVVYASERPNPWPRTFGFHEVFHTLVIAAAAVHYAVISLAVV